MRLWVVALAGVVGMALAPLLAENVWIEAEAPSATNFPPSDKNPFAPTAFWEENILSGGAWIGAYWEFERGEQPFLEYEFETKAPGDFALYARKFYTYGNFRWRVDDGLWREVPMSLHEELDNVSLRDTPNEKISVTWHYMGSEFLKPGRHRLRIEPMPGKMPVRRPGQEHLPGYPLAYDAYLFTTEPFFPAGKLRPGEEFELRGTGGFAFRAGRDSFRLSPIDWRQLNESYAGERGGIVVRDGQLVFRSDGAEVRLVGVNLRPGPNAAPETLAYLARLLAKKGVNLARMDIGHLFEGVRRSDGQRELRMDEAMLEVFLRQAAELKAQGIYLALTWNFSNIRELASLAGFEKGSYPEGGDTSPLVLFDRRVQDLIVAGWERVLLERLPGSEVPLARDPALALITLGQQLSAFAWPGPMEPPLPAEIAALREASFRHWLEERYGGLEKAAAAWEKAGERLPEASQPWLPTVPDLALGGARAQDAVRFLAEAQRQWIEALEKRLRSLTGYEGLVSYSNRPPPLVETLGLPSAWASLTGDITERIGVFIAPYEAPLNIWVVAAGGRFEDRSALRLDPYPGLDAARFELPLRVLDWNGKPGALTEVGWSAPNRFRGEGPLVAAVLASLQDVRMLAFQGLSGFNWHQSLPHSRVPLFTPATLGQFPAIAYAFRQGLLPGPFRAALWSLPEQAFFTLKPAPLHDMREALITAPILPVASPPEGPPGLGLAGKVEVRTVAGPEKFVIEEDAATGVSSDVMLLGRGAVEWDIERGLMVVRAPKFQAVAGFLKLAGPQSAGLLEVRSEMDFGIVCLISLDSKPLEFSSRMLLQVFSEEHNTGEFIEEGRPRILRSVGRPPLLVRELQGIVTLARPDAREILATALDANGYPILPAGHAHALSLLPATLYYLLEK